MNQADEQRNNGVATPRHPYSTPSLVEYGPVSKLTQSGVTSTNSDSGSNKMRPTVCL
jgi:hypothetical protein